MPAFETEEGFSFAVVMETKCVLRRAAVSDVDSIDNVFHEAVMHAKEYSVEQRQAWAAARSHPTQWIAPIADQHFIVAEMDALIVGFASVTPAGYLDFLFVAPDFQRKGIALALLKEVERSVRLNEVTLITTYASISALPFFTANGFAEVRPNEVHLNGQVLVNYQMEKVMTTL